MRSILKKLLLLSFLFTCTYTYSQDVEADSLKKVLDTVGENHQRVLVLEGLSFAYRSAYPDTALQYALQGLKLAQQIGDRVGEAYCTNALGNVYFAVSDYPAALDMYLQSLEMKESLKDQQHAIGVTYFNIANVYTELKDYRHALDYLFKTMKADENVKDTGGILFDQYSLSSIYLRMNKIDSALYFAEKAYQLALQLNDENLIGAIVNNYGEIYFTLNNYPLAEKKYRQSIDYAKVVNDNEILATNYFGVARVFEKRQQPDSSIFYAKKSLSIAESAPFLKQVLEVSTFLTGMYKSAEQYDSAFRYQELSIATKDSLFNIEKIQKVQALKLQEQQRQQAVEVAKIKYRNRITVYVVIFVCCVFLFIAILLWRTNRQRRKDNNLLQEQKSRTDQALKELTSAQAQLLQKEKMASLGELTAGIAHEIKNPLNFINNFAELNAELLDELKEKIDSELPADKEEEKAIHKDLKQNLQKIISHGKRADAIVKNMLEHSRGLGGVKELTNINALADEYFKIAYQGIRATDKTFVAVMETYFDASLSTEEGKINIVPQDIGRVLLNLYNNAFYAVNKKYPRPPKGELAYQPTVSVFTKAVKFPSPKGVPGTGNLGVVLTVRDNGNGIPEKTVGKIFEPFYTTKPTGEGTGLGLSLSYNIVTKAYGGELKVNTKEGEYAEFVIELPR